MKAADTIYIATVDIPSQRDNEREDDSGVYVYQAKLHFKQSTPTDVVAHAKDTEYTNDIVKEKYYATHGFVTLISLWDLALAGIDTVSVPCVNRGKHFENIASIPGVVQPDTTIKKLQEHFGKSIDLREIEEDATVASALEIFGFSNGTQENEALQDLLKVDLKTGELTGAGACRYKILVRIQDEEERPRVGYLPIQYCEDEDDDKDKEDEEELCGVGGFPGTLEIEENTEWSDVFAATESDVFPGRGTEDDAFPGKAHVCW